MSTYIRTLYGIEMVHLLTSSGCWCCRFGAYQFSIFIEFVLTLDFLMNTKTTLSHMRTFIKLLIEFLLPHDSIVNE